ncbi:TPA: hypothetical protein KD091_004656 [Vibrio parahaemolyticus]|jgi:hypothetical protein|nr:hypothetical protein [Vibrio parahaemolyticus]
MEIISDFDIELAMRIKVITPFTLAHASPEFIAYWLAVTLEAERRQPTFSVNQES